MTPAEHQQLNGIIEALASVQAQAPTKTTYAMGRADHSISHQLLDIIRQLKALADNATSSTESRSDAELDPFYARELKAFANDAASEAEPEITITDGNGQRTTSAGTAKNSKHSR